MVINISVQYSGGFLPDIILFKKNLNASKLSVVDPRLLPVGNPFKYHVVALYLQPL